MSSNSPENQDEDYKNVWQTVYRIIALALLVSMFLHLIGVLMFTLGISLNGSIVLLFFPSPPFG